MVRFFLSLLLFVLCGNSYAGVYKCMHVDGKIEYQAAPCITGKELPVKAPMPTSQEVSSRPVKSNAQRPCGGKNIQLKFESLSVLSLLGILADYSGNKLQAEESIGARGAFDYQCMPIVAVLQDVALRYNLDIRIENGTIYARQR